jgi:integrase
MRSGSLYTHGGARKYLTGAERTRFIGAAERCGRADVRALCLTLAYTGCRISEALALTPSAITADEGAIILRSLKRRNGAVAYREVPVPATLLSLLEETFGLRARAATARLWPLSRSRAWFLIKRVMADAGIAPGIHATPKGLRHGFGLHAVRSGVPLNLVQRWLGHASMTTTAIYLQAIGDEERELAARMWTASPCSQPAACRSAPETGPSDVAGPLRWSVSIEVAFVFHTGWP